MIGRPSRALRLTLLASARGTDDNNEVITSTLVLMHGCATFLVARGVVDAVHDASHAFHFRIAPETDPHAVGRPCRRGRRGRAHRPRVRPGRRAARRRPGLRRPPARSPRCRWRRRLYGRDALESCGRGCPPPGRAPCRPTCPRPAGSGRPRRPRLAWTRERRCPSASSRTAGPAAGPTASSAEATRRPARPPWKFAPLTTRVACRTTATSARTSSGGRRRATGALAQLVSYVVTAASVACASATRPRATAPIWTSSRRAGSTARAPTGRTLRCCPAGAARRPPPPRRPAGVQPRRPAEADARACWVRGSNAASVGPVGGVRARPERGDPAGGRPALKQRCGPLRRAARARSAGPNAAGRVRVGRGAVRHDAERVRRDAGRCRRRRRRARLA